MSSLSKKTIAITGSMGSGKSTAKNILIEKGFPVFDADQSVLYLYENDQELIETFKVRYPEVILDDKINNTLIKRYLNHHSAQLKVIEDLVHPKVWDAYLDFVAASESDWVFAEIPLLFVVDWQYHFDEVLCVHTSQAKIINRLIKNRKISKKAILGMLALQLDPENKCAMSTIVLYNDKEIRDLKHQIELQLERLEREKHEDNRSIHHHQ